MGSLAGGIIAVVVVVVVVVEVDGLSVEVVVSDSGMAVGVEAAMAATLAASPVVTSTSPELSETSLSNIGIVIS
jgi:hypothetical protein